MATYGSFEAKPKQRLSPALIQIKKDLAGLERRRVKLQRDCKHYFMVPHREPRMKKTTVRGTFDAARVGEIDGKSMIMFDLTCLKCELMKRVSVSDHCPCCGNRTHGRWGPHDELQKYFPIGQHTYDGLWLISCSRCDFSAAGLREDR